MVAYRFLEIRVCAIVHIRTGFGDVSQWWRAEAIQVSKITGSQESPTVIGSCFAIGQLAWAQVGDQQVVMLLIGQQRACVALRAIGFAIKQQRTLFF